MWQVNAGESCRNLSRNVINILHNKSCVDTMAPSVAQSNSGNTCSTAGLRSQFTAHAAMHPCISQPADI